MLEKTLSNIDLKKSQKIVMPSTTPEPVAISPDGKVMPWKG